VKQLPRIAGYFKLILNLQQLSSATWLQPAPQPPLALQQACGCETHRSLYPEARSCFELVPVITGANNANFAPIVCFLQIHLTSLVSKSLTRVKSSFLLISFDHLLCIASCSVTHRAAMYPKQIS
jgi:hypothetical protein